MASGKFPSILANIRALEKATFLPGLPKEAQPRHSDGTHRLHEPLERRLVDELVFLSASNDDPTKVMALALEESTETDTMTIRLACNTGVPQITIDGFKTLALLLQDVRKRGNPEKNKVIKITDAI